jgi:DNA polymerase-3 subunit gamma/tau
MEKFIVSARKYRPATFNEVVGQPHIVTTLKNAISSNHIAHSFLFCGPRGVGKTTCARVLAKVINCEQRTGEVEACNVCPSCKSLNERSSLNIYELDAASNNSVDDIRSLVDQMRYAPTSGLYKIYIIDEVHMLSQAAFNAFLKTLEEPPSYAIFILATTEKHKVLPTILSRCQVFDFKSIQPEAIVQQLQHIAASDHITYDAAALDIISQKSDGSLRDALSMLDVIVSFGAGKLTYAATLETLHILDHSYYLRLVDAFLTENIQACLLIYDEVLQSGFDGFYFLEGLLEHTRNVLVAQDAITLPLLAVPLHLKETYHQQAKKASANFWLETLQRVNKYAMQYKESCNKRFHIELMLVELASKSSALALSAMHVDQSTSKLSIEKAANTYGNAIAPSQASTVSVKTSTATASIVPLTIAAKDSKNTTSVSNETKLQETHSPLSITTSLAPAISQEEMSTNKAEEIVLQKTIKMPQVSKLTPPPPTLQAIACDVDERGDYNKRVDLTLKRLQPFWEAYREQLKEEGKLAGYNLMHREMEIQGGMILIKLTNPAEETILEGFKAHLIDYLRKALANDVLSITSKWDAHQVTTAKPYTAQEKFQYLADKHPLLQSLKTTLALEIVD